MPECKLLLDNYNGQYFPGTQIQGRVLIIFNSETKLRGIKINVMCHEHTEFMATESYFDPTDNERKSRDTMFVGDNDAFLSELMLYGSNSGTTSLPAGQHIYPFSVTLPGVLPGTYHCEYGSINYKIVAVVDRPMAFDYEDQMIFIVASPVDLNNLRRPQLLEPSSYSDDKTVCCLCCAQGPISLDVELPRMTLVPGETIIVTARLTNMSNTNIEGVGLKLKQIINCKVDTPSSEEKRFDNVLVELNEVGLGAHGEHTYTFPVMLPMNVTIPNFSLCKLFKVEYVCKVEARLPGVHQDLEIQMVLEIGNIQIGNAPGGFQVPPQEGFQYSPPGGNHQGYQPVAPQPGAYSPYLAGPGNLYPSPGGQYPPYHAPPVGGVSVYPPSAPVGVNQKAAEGAGGVPSAPRDEQAPPSYDSLSFHEKEK